MLCQYTSLDRGPLIRPKRRSGFRLVVAINNVTSSLRSVGALYAEGVWVTRTYNAAVEWFQLAAAPWGQQFTLSSGNAAVGRPRHAQRSPGSFQTHTAKRHQQAIVPHRCNCGILVCLGNTSAENSSSPPVLRPLRTPSVPARLLHPGSSPFSRPGCPQDAAHGIDFSPLARCGSVEALGRFIANTAIANSSADPAQAYTMAGRGAEIVQCAAACSLRGQSVNVLTLIPPQSEFSNCWRIVPRPGMRCAAKLL